MEQYKESIESLKKLIDSYNEQENIIAERYKQIIEGSKNEAKNKIADAEKRYITDRNDAYYDSLMGDRDTANILAKRGLGRSGEVAQAKINSEILLNGRLGKLAEAKNASIADITAENDKYAAGLENEKEKALGDITKKKADILADIANIQIKKEEAEQKAAANTASSSGHGASGNTTQKEPTEKPNNASSGAQGGYTPTVSAKELAKTLITNSQGEDKEARDRDIGKYIIKLIDSYGVTDDYLNELLFILGTYGYEKSGKAEMEKDVLYYESKEYRDGIYEKMFTKYSKDGMARFEAHDAAQADAEKKQLEYISANAKNIDQFRDVCDRLGISRQKQHEYVIKLDKSVIGEAAPNDPYRVTDLLQFSTKK